MLFNKIFAFFTNNVILFTRRKMKYYQDFAQFPAFTLNDAMQVMDGGAANAPQILNAMVKKGSVRRIRQNLYTCTDFVNGGDVATRFDIASKITPSSLWPITLHSSSMDSTIRFSQKFRSVPKAVSPVLMIKVIHIVTLPPIL